MLRRQRVSVAAIGIGSLALVAFAGGCGIFVGGSAINSWLVWFPAAEKATYEPIIEQVHRDYRVGTGNCAQRVTGNDKR